MAGETTRIRKGDGAVMRRLLTIALFLLPITAFGTPAFVRGTSGNNPTTSLAFTSNTIHDTLIVVIEVPYPAGFTVVSDSAGNTYHLANVSPDPGYGVILFMFIVEDCKASAGTNTVTINSSGTPVRMVIAEYSGVSNVRPLRSGSINAQGNSATPASSAMTSVSGDLVVAAAFPGSTASAGSGYTLRFGTNNLALEDGIASGTSVTPSFTITSASWMVTAVVLSSSGNGAATSDTGIVQWNSNEVFLATTATVTLPSVTAGHRLIAGVSVTASGLTISASDGTNTWNCPQQMAGGTDTMAYCYAENIAGSASPVTVTFSWGGSTHTAYAMVVENTSTTTPTLRYTGDDNNFAAGFFAPVAPTAVNDMVFGCIDLNNISGVVFAGPTAGNFLGGNGSGGQQMNCYQVLASGTSAQPDAHYASATNPKHVVATFKTASSAASTLVQARSCFGAGCAFVNSVTSGNLLTAASAADSFSTCSLGWISDTRTSTWAVDANVVSGANTNACIYHGLAGGTGAETITLSPSGQALGIAEWSGYNNTVSAQTTITPGSSPWTMSSVTAPNNSLVITAIRSDAFNNTCTSSNAIMAANPLVWSFYEPAPSGSLAQTCTNGSAAGLVVFPGAGGSSGPRHRSVMY